MDETAKYGKVTSESKKFEEGEPLFILRGQDRLAATAVRFYATLRMAIGDMKGATEAMKVADRMEEWPKRKYPD